MRKIEMHFASGWDFFDDYKLFIGAIVDTRGQRGELRLRRGSRSRSVAVSVAQDQEPQMERHGHQDTHDAANGEAGCVVKIDDGQRAEVEQTVWAYARRSPQAKREEWRRPANDVELIVGA